MYVHKTNMSEDKTILINNKHVCIITIQVHLLQQSLSRYFYFCFQKRSTAFQLKYLLLESKSSNVCHYNVSQISNYDYNQSIRSHDTLLNIGKTNHITSLLYGLRKDATQAMYKRGQLGCIIAEIPGH